MKKFKVIEESRFLNKEELNGVKGGICQSHLVCVNGDYQTMTCGADFQKLLICLA